MDLLLGLLHFALCLLTFSLRFRRATLPPSVPCPMPVSPFPVTLLSAMASTCVEQKARKALSAGLVDLQATADIFLRIRLIQRNLFKFVASIADIKDLESAVHPPGAGGKR